MLSLKRKNPMTMTASNPSIDITDKEVRLTISNNLVFFIAVYLSHYVQLEAAPFHYQLSEALTDKETELMEIIGFRDSAKSTYATLAFPLWCALFKKYKFIVLINDTNEQVK